MIGIPLGAFELRDEIFVADLGWVAVSGYVPVVLALALDVHVAGVPVALFDSGLRAPVRPDAELRLSIPVGKLVVLQGLGSAGEGTGRKRERDGLSLRKCAARAGGGGRKESEGTSSGKVHFNVYSR